MKAPTISRLFGTDYYALETVAVKSEINLLIPKLKKHGAEDILELHDSFEANARARRFYERRGWTADGERQPLPIVGQPKEVRYRRTLEG